jgi:prolyl-tRNA synthetase
VRWTDLAVQTYREPTHPVLVRAGYVTPDRRLTALGQRLAAVVFATGLPEALTTLADGPVRRVAEWARGRERFGRCPGCGYEGFDVAWPTAAVGRDALVEHFTPDCPGIEAVVARLGVRADEMLKCYAAGDTVVLVPGDREVRNPPPGEPAAGLAVGYIGPMGLRERGLRVLADRSVAARPGPWCTGANKPDRHVTGATLGRDFDVHGFGPFAVLREGDPCPNCGRPMALVPAVEVQAADGAVDRLRVLTLLAERFSDDAGLVWPPALAPFSTHVITLRGCEAEGLAVDAADVLWDDRPGVSPGVKFADADLIGLPTQVVIGPKSAARGVVEVKDRRTGARSERPAQTGLWST